MGFYLSKIAKLVAIEMVEDCDLQKTRKIFDFMKFETLFVCTKINNYLRHM